MANDKTDPQKGVTEAIKRDRPAATLEMPGPGGAAVRRAGADQAWMRDQQAYDGNRAAKYAKMEKPSIASREDVREGSKGILGKEFNHERDKGRG